MFRLFLMLAMMIAGAASWSAPAIAQGGNWQQIECASFREPARCPIDIGRAGFVKLMQVTNPPCDQGRTWGWDANSIWVSGNCRAVFSVNRAGGGGNGGGGMCPPLNNGVWIYGPSDDTLFRLVALGSKKLQEAGFARISPETPALMPQQGGTTITKSGDLWKIIAWIKSMNAKDQTSIDRAPILNSRAAVEVWTAQHQALAKVCHGNTSSPWDGANAR